MTGASVNERDEVVELLVREQRAALNAGQTSLAGFLESLHGAVRRPPLQLDALERARADVLRSLAPGAKPPAVVDRAMRLLKAGGTAARSEASGASRAPSPNLARASGSRTAPAPTSDPLANLPSWLKDLIAKLKAFFSGKASASAPAAPAAPVRRLPEKRQPPPMQPEEKAFFDALTSEEQATYGSLPHAQRELARAPQGRARLAAPADPSGGAGDPSAWLTAALFATLGEAPDAPSTRGPLRGVVLQTVANLLRETGGNVAAVKTRGLASLLDQTEFSGLLLGNVERELLALPPSTRPGVQGYHEAFKRLRPELITHARKLIYPGLTSAELVGALVDAIVEVVDQQPRAGSRRGAGARGKKVAFQGRFIRG